MKRGKSEKIVWVLITASIMLIGCRGPLKADPPASTRQVTDDLGRTAVLPVTITRAVSLAPSVTENIFAVGAGDRLVGVTTFCNYPEQAKAIAKVGDTLNPNLETIIALKPDVVFVSTASQIEAFTNTLADNHIAVYVTDPKGLDGIIRGLKQLGQLFGTTVEADRVVAGLQTRIANISRSTDGKTRERVFVQFSREPLFTMGKQSFLNEVLERAGATSVTANVETAFPKLSKETALALQPDYIILSQSDDNQEPNEAFRGSPAVRNHRVFSVDADLLSRPGPRLIDAMEQIAGEIHK